MGAPPVLGAAPAEPLVPLEQGETVGRYTVEGVIARGGMAIVYRLQDPAGGPPVALKVGTHVSRGITRDVLAREFRVMVRLNHPNIVRVLDFGQVRGRPCLFMEYVEGELVTDLIARAAEASPAERVALALDVLRQVAVAVAALHAEKVVHRDLKPDNLIRTDEGAIKVMDFGIARADHTEALVTRKGVVVGTLAYMSPEQISSGPMDHRSDLYSLGVIAYEALTGHTPFRATEPLDWLHKHVNERPAPPSRFNAETPAGLETLILALLAKAPVDRPESAEDVTDLLDLIPTGRDAARTGADAGEGLPELPPLQDPRFVGRLRELDLLERNMTTAAAGHGRVVLVHGEHGMGKRTLVRVFARRAAQRGATVLEAVCSRRDGPPLNGFAGVAAGLLANMVERGHNFQGGHWPTTLGVLNRAFPALRRALPEPMNQARAVADVDARRVAQSLASLFEDVTASQPVLLVVRGFERGDDATMAFVQGLADRANEVSMSLLILAIANGSESEMEALTRQAGLHPETWLAVGPLGLPETRELLGQMLGGHVASARLTEQLARECGGRPGFVLATMQELVRQQKLAARRAPDDRVIWSLKGGRPEELPLPAVVREVLLRRLGTLDAVSRSVLTVAAVAREGIPRELCEATQVVQGKGEAEVRDAITRLLQCQMLAERGEGLELGSSFLRTLVLDELPPTAVRSQHRHLARAAERYFGQVGATALEARAEMLAHHYLQAGEVLDAARQLLVAAYRLRQQGDLLTAELVLDRGERLLNEQQVVNRATRLRALRALRAEVRAGLGNLKGALENARWVLDSAREAGHAEMEARAWQAVARAQIRSGKVKEAREAARSACDTWQAMGRKVELARARALLGEADALGGDFDLGEKELADAVQSASTMQDVDGERTALLALAGVHLARWRPEQALERLQQLQRIPGAETLEVKMARLPREAHALLMTGRFDAARQLSEELREAVHRLSSRWPLARTRAAAASAATWLALGDLVAAEKRLKSAEQGALRDGYLVTWVRIQGWRAELALERQEPDRAIGLLERGESAAAAAHLEPLRRELMATRAWAVFERGDHEQASGLLKQLVQPGVQVSEQVVIDGMLLVAALRIARGEHEAAERTSREAVERAEQVGLWEQRLLASHLLGQALAHTLSSEAALWVAKSRRQIETVVKDWPAVSAERFRCRRRVRQVLASGTGE